MKKLFYILLVPLSIFAQVTYQKSKFDQVWYDASYEKSHSTFALFDTSSIKLYYTVTGKPLFDIYDQAGLRVFHLDSLGVTHADSLAVGTFLYSGANFADSLRGAGFTKDVDEWFDSNGILSAGIKNGAILNEDINSSAAISGTKISPNFGSQDVLTKGLFKHNVTDSTDDDEWLKPYGFFSRDTLVANSIINPDSYGITNTEIRTAFIDNGGDGSNEWPIGLAVISDVPAGNSFYSAFGSYDAIYLSGNTTRSISHEAFTAFNGGTATEVIGLNANMSIGTAFGTSGNLTNVIGVGSQFIGNPTSGSAITNAYGFKYTKPSAYTRYTNMYGLYLDSVVGVSGNAYSIYSAGGDAYFEDDVTADTVKAAIQDGRIYNAAINASAAIAGSKLADHGITYAKLDTGAAGYIDVRKFGAKGDSLTDDTAAIQAAINYMVSFGGNKPALYFPSGNYIVSSGFNTITTKPCQFIGHRARIIFTASSSDTLFRFGAFTSAPSYIWSGTAPEYKFDGIDFQTNQTALANEGSRVLVAIEDNGCGDAEITNCWFKGFDVAINLRFGADFMRINKCYFMYNDVGLYCGPGFQQGDIQDCGFAVNKTSLIMEGAGKSEIKNCSFIDEDDYCIMFRDSVMSLSGIGGAFITDQRADMSVVVSDCWFESGGGFRSSNVQSDFIFLNGSRSATYPRNIRIKEAFVAAGTFIGEKVNSFLRILGGRRISIDRVTFEGNEYNYVVDNDGGSIVSVKNPLAVDGYTLQTMWSKATAKFPTITENGTNFKWQYSVTGNDSDMVFNGRFGVGTLTPSDKVEVEGGVVADSIKVGASDVGVIYKTADNTIGIQTLLDGQKLAGYNYGSTSNKLVLQPILGLVGIGPGVPQKRLTIGDGTDRYSLDVATDKLTFFNDASIPVSTATLDSVGTFAPVALDADSVTVGPGGIWQRDWYYNAADSSVAMVFYNTTLARIDTVFMKQP